MYKQGVGGFKYYVGVSSLGQIATHDPDFLEWLERSPAGRHLRGEIADIRRTAQR